MTSETFDEVESVLPEPETAAQQRRRWRQRGLDKMSDLRTSVQRLERLAVVLPLLSDADAIWDEFLDDETKRLRDSLRRHTPATLEIQSLVAQNQQLRELLKDHQLAAETISSVVMQHKDVDSWDGQVESWKQLARTHFRPRKVEECIAELNAAMVEASQFTYAHDKQTSGLHFMGWQDGRRIDAASSTFQFSIHKTYRGHDLAKQTTMCWRVYTETDLYRKGIMGGRGHAHVDVLEQLTPTLLVVLYHERYEGMDVNFHTLAVLAIIESDVGATQFIRTIDAPDLEDVFQRGDNMWVRKSYWKQVDLLDASAPRDEPTDFYVSVCGTMHGHDPSYVNFWLVELLAMLVRSECLLTGRLLLKF